MAHIVICPYCKQKFDRDKEEYVVVSSRRYAHAACMLREAEKDPNYIKKEIIDPTDTVICVYCKKEMSKKDKDCIYLGNNKYVHNLCKNLEEKREKTDKEKLEEYIKKLFNMDYIDPRIRKQLNSYINEYNYTYSGIQKALYYFFEIKGNSIEKANGGIGIVPHVYQQAYNYYYNLWLAKQKNKDVEINLYVPQIKEIVISRPEVKIKKRKLFSFLDEEDENAE